MDEKDLYVIAYEGKSEIIDGEDAMQIRVCEICDEYNIEADEVHVFLMSDEL
jgi:hypothetical protein